VSLIAITGGQAAVRVVGLLGCAPVRSNTSLIQVSGPVSLLRPGDRRGTPAGGAGAGLTVRARRARAMIGAGDDG